MSDNLTLNNVLQAVVVGYEPGKGRFQGKVGALRCKMANGKLFSVGSG
jgi:DNA ligase-1